MEMRIRRPEMLSEHRSPWILIANLAWKYLGVCDVRRKLLSSCVQSQLGGLPYGMARVRNPSSPSLRFGSWMHNLCRRGVCSCRRAWDERTSLVHTHCKR